MTAGPINADRTCDTRKATPVVSESIRGRVLEVLSGGGPGAKRSQLNVARPAHCELSREARAGPFEEAKLMRMRAWVGAAWRWPWPGLLWAPLRRNVRPVKRR